MYYDRYRGKKRRGRRRENAGCGSFIIGSFFKLLLTVIILLAITVGGLLIVPVSFMNIAPDSADLSLTRGLPADYINVLLLGLDFKNEGQQRCDCIIVASISNSKAKFTSLQRDTLVDIPGYSGKHKLNAAFSYGGAELTMRVVNETFGLNITDYIAVDFETMVNAVDAIGGIDMTIEEKELYWYNKYAYRTYRALCRINEAKYASYLTADDEVTQAGPVHMDGIHATGYCRIRYVDSDYGRTNRQRKVIAAILKQVRKKIYDPRIYVNLMTVLREGVQTSMPITALAALGTKMVAAEFSDGIIQYRVPQNEYIHDNGSSIEIKDADGMKRDLFNFIYLT